MINIKSVKQSDVRRMQVITRAASGVTTRAIARELNMSEPAVSRILTLRESQEALAEVIESLNDQLESRLPPLLIKALDAVETTLERPYSDSDRLRAAELVLKIATRFAELTVKSK
jgi:F420-dependent methylenetetrahydromethanopterin dehydrogenase